MTTLFFEIGLVLLAYFWGCISVGYYYCQFRTGDDVRLSGNGLTSAQNVRQSCGKVGYAITLAAEVFQGFAAVTFVGMYGTSFSAALLALIAVTFGNVAPLQLQLRGGKGLAVALGGLAAFQPTLLFCFASTYGVFRTFFSSAVVARVLATLAIPALALALGNPPQYIALLCALCLVLVFAERQELAGEFNKMKTRVEG